MTSLFRQFYCIIQLTLFCYIQNDFGWNRTHKIGMRCNRYRTTSLGYGEIERYSKCNCNYTCVCLLSTHTHTHVGFRHGHRAKCFRHSFSCEHGAESEESGEDGTLRVTLRKSVLHIYIGCSK